MPPQQSKDVQGKAAARSPKALSKSTAKSKGLGACVIVRKRPLASKKKGEGRADASKKKRAVICKPPSKGMQERVTKLDEQHAKLLRLLHKNEQQREKLTLQLLQDEDHDAEKKGAEKKKIW